MSFGVCVCFGEQERGAVKWRRSSPPYAGVTVVVAASSSERKGRDQQRERSLCKMQGVSATGK